MNIGIIGLGRMGLSIADRLIKGNHTVHGYDPNEDSRNQARTIGTTIVSSLEELCQQTSIIWLMVPAGDVTNNTIKKLKPFLKKEAIIIDGGNSFFEDSIRNYNDLASSGIHFIDCGTSGGLKGRDVGFSLMIGGDKKIFDQVKPLFESIAAPNGFALMGPAGSGHYVKMVHNGIEYALLQAYAEGLHLIKEGHYKNIDLEQVSKVWQHGSVVRSWIVDLLHNIFSQDQELKTISGAIDENKTGRWTLDEAKKQNIPVKLIEDALNIRSWSRETGGNFGTKVVAMLRNQFGGHPVKKLDKK